MKKLPIGIQSFQKIIKGDFLYVDKTNFLYDLIVGGSYYFLSRPRRFGKSLLISALKEIFEGNQSLFSGLWIEKKWNWEERSPVIHIPFSTLNYQKDGVTRALANYLDELSTGFGLRLKEGDHKDKFRDLINQLYAQAGRVVILIDEYDKPIIDYIGNDITLAQENGRALKAFYSIIKDSDPHLRFVFITGVSKFSKVSIFSDLNNLEDITLDWRYSQMLGYTQEELEHYFPEEIEATGKRLGMSREMLLAEIRRWYNGYTWDKENYVYNPFSILNFFSKREFQNFWFKTATPTFLVELIRKNPVYKLEEVQVGQAVFDSFEIKEKLDIYSLLFQTGYLTIKGFIKEFRLYLLGYPNLEVRDSMREYLIGGFSDQNPSEVPTYAFQLKQAFYENDLGRVVRIMNSLLKNIPNQIFPQTEAFFHAIIHLMFKYLGVFIESEVNVSDGRADAFIQTPTHIYCLEFKLNQSAEVGLRQIIDRGYLDRFTSEKQKVAAGINFNTDSRKIDDWQQMAIQT